jgi:hypothetical protein
MLRVVKPMVEFVSAFWPNIVGALLAIAMLWGMGAFQP